VDGTEQDHPARTPAKREGRVNSKQVVTLSVILHCWHVRERPHCLTSANWSTISRALDSASRAQGGISFDLLRTLLQRAGVELNPGPDMVWMGTMRSKDSGLARHVAHLIDVDVHAQIDAGVHHYRVAWFIDGVLHTITEHDTTIAELVRTIHAGLLLMEGVEANPGPGPEGKMALKRQRDVKLLKVKRRKDVEAIVEQVKGELERLKGSQDAAAEIAAESAASAEGSESPPMPASCEPPKFRPVCGAGCCPSSAAWHCFDPADKDAFGFNPLWLESSESVHTLRCWPWPHKVCEAHLLAVEPAVRRCCPHDANVTVPRGDWTTARYLVTLRSYGVLGELVNEITEEQLITVEQYVLARSKRYGQDSCFYDAVKSIRAFRSAYCSTGGDNASSNALGELNDQLFTALLGCEQHRLSATVWLRLAATFGEKMLNRAIQKDQGPVVAAGTYVEGYQVDFFDLFPARIKEGLEKMAAGVPSREAATRVVSGLIQDSSSYVSKRGAALSDEGKKLVAKARTYCRMLPHHVEDFIPTFPDPFSQANSIVSAVKRLMRKVKEPSHDSRLRAALVADAMCAKMQLFPIDEVSDPQIHEKCEQDARAETSWSSDQFDDFMEGVRCVTSNNWERIKFELNRFGTFMKDETADPDKKKALRYISAPIHFIRGVFNALLHLSEHHLFKVFELHCVKGCDSLGIREKMMREFDHVWQSIFESDFVSFESQVDSARQALHEGKVLAAACPFTV